MYLIAEKGPLKGIVISLEEGEEWTIGRDPDLVDFVLEDNTVSRKHAKCYKTPEGIYIQDLSKTNPLEVNGVVIDKPHLIKENDKFKIGHTVFLASKKKPKGLRKSKLVKKEYETIFEAPKEDLPFNLISEVSLILKVLSGPNTGAEFGMEKGRDYIIGKDPAICDIVFNDLSVSKKHARITVDAEGKITIEDLGSKNGTFINGLRVKEKTHLELQKTIKVGTTSFLIIDQEALAETIFSPPIEKAIEEKVEEEIVKKEFKKIVIPKKHLILMASILVISFTAFLGFFSLFKGKKIEIVERDPNEEIQEALKNFEDIQFSYTPVSEKLFLIGHVLTIVDHKKLLYIIEQMPYVTSIEDNIIVDEYVWENINNVIAENPIWRGITIHSPRAGRFIMRGYLKNLKEYDELNDYINSNFDYVNRLENKVIVEDVLNARVANLFLSEGLFGINFDLSAGELIIGGRYGEKEEKRFEKALEELKKTEGIEKIENFAIQTTTEESYIDLSDRYKVSGFAKHKDVNISVVMNDQIVAVDDIIDGMKVLEIKTNMIILEKDGLKYKVNYSM